MRKYELSSNTKTTEESLKKILKQSDRTPLRVQDEHFSEENDSFYVMQNCVHLNLLSRVVLNSAKLWPICNSIFSAQSFSICLHSGVVLYEPYRVPWQNSLHTANLHSNRNKIGSLENTLILQIKFCIDSRFQQRSFLCVCLLAVILFTPDSLFACSSFCLLQIVFHKEPVSRFWYSLI